MNKKILIVENDILIANMLLDLLLEEGYTVCVCNDTDSAFKLLNESSEPFDLVITDLNLPHKSGDELIHNVRLTDSIVPIILMSGELPLGLAPVLNIFDNISYIKKPFKINDILSIVAQSVNNLLEMQGPESYD